MEHTEGYHVGLIMDGNGRWATQQNKPRLFGHAAGVEAVKHVVREAPKANVHTISLFAFAIANWTRDKEEVDGLWELFSQFVAQDLRELISNNVRVRVIGNRSMLPDKILVEIEQVESESADNTGLLLQIALSYDGVDEVARMLQRALRDGVDPTSVDEQYVRDHLDTEAGNEPDIVLRTGMKAKEENFSYWRSSAFLPLQSAQSVCVGSTTLWPDFSIDELKEVIVFADPDERLFGGQR